MPLLPLETWRDYISYHPWHFWGMSNALIPVQSACNVLVRERSYYDSDAAGRADIRRAIDDTVEKFVRVARFRPAPQYVVEESIPIAQDQAQLNFLLPSGIGSIGVNFPFAWRTGGYTRVQLREGWIQALGVEDLDLIDTPAVSYSDPDGDGLNELFTATVATTVTDPAELAVYFAEADRLNNEEAGDTNRIEPVNISISGGNATITGPAWLLVKPILYQGFGQAGGGLDPDVAGNFVTTLDVYRRTTDTTNPVTITAVSGGSCCASGTETSILTTATIEDARNGILSLAGLCGCSTAKRVTVRYLAGYPLINRQMAPAWASVIAKFATAELNRKICGCDEGNQSVFALQFDLALIDGMAKVKYALSDADRNNPFGTRLGQIEAWRAVRHAYQTIGHLI